MQLKLLNEEACKAEKLFDPFVNEQLTPGKSPALFSDDEVNVGDLEPFPIYMAGGSEEDRKKNFFKAIKIFERDYLHFDREYKMEGRFWYSLYSIHFKNYLINQYPQVKDDVSNFRKIVLKKFDWENYIYKIVLIVEYVTETFDAQEARDKYYHLILDNLDVFNYLIKYSIFRNREFVMNILKIIHNNDLTEVLKSNIDYYKKQGRDERYGRRVIFEFNRRYPVLMSPMMYYENLEETFLEYLNQYRLEERKI